MRRHRSGDRVDAGVLGASFAGPVGTVGSGTRDVAARSAADPPGAAPAPVAGAATDEHPDRTSNPAASNVRTSPRADGAGARSVARPASMHDHLRKPILGKDGDLAGGSRVRR
ncbi:hypothetical protein GCM10011594_32770 [Nakamurella endophytica]|uniref:Uncharacterized protein n=1 Tax=Nakamurella endophytica TaxID=1748367 RepID=A0A917T604_9ACTN|nr:hypothetical protein GCM10011594_32770 [Nakamurella endophytica]